MLRSGNHASAKFWRRVLLPLIKRYRHLDIPKLFRGDAAFANPALYRLLEKEGYRYVIRLKANAVLEREIEHLLTRPVGRPSRRPKVFHHGFQYQAKSWQHSLLSGLAITQLEVNPVQVVGARFPAMTGLVGPRGAFLM